MLTDWLLAAGILARGAEKFSRTYNDVVWEEENKGKIDLLNAIETTFYSFCGSRANDPTLIIMRYNERDRSKETFETLRLLYEFSKVSPIMWKKLNAGQRYYGDPYMERHFYGETTVNKFIECNPETIRLGYGDDILRMDDEMMTTLDDIKERGYGHGIVRTIGDYGRRDGVLEDMLCNRIISWNSIAWCMDRKLKYAIRNAFAPCTREKFFAQYFDIAPKDMYFSHNVMYSLPYEIQKLYIKIPSDIPIKNIIIKQSPS